MILAILAFLLVYGWFTLYTNLIAGVIIFGVGVSGSFAWVAYLLLRRR